MESLKSLKVHRPLAMPDNSWSYHQQWKNVVFLHYRVNEKLLRTLVQYQLKLDKFNGECWVSVLVFNVEQIYPKLLSSINSISNFHQLNIRAYVKSNEKPGVYFLSIEASKSLS